MEMEFFGCCVGGDFAGVGLAGGNSKK
ncbi:protein of unknown function [Pseudomonas sp. JV241A]|nr:protein of unknown function [Pseudomonas sp. JV241A]